MPNVDDHGLEVLKKAAVDLDSPPKKRNYALQVIAQTKLNGENSFHPEIFHVDLPQKNTEYEISLPLNYGFVLRQRKASNARLSFVVGGTNSNNFITLPFGDGWEETKRLSTNKIYMQSEDDANLIEIVVYK